MPQFVMAIDQGTTSSRAIVFDNAGNVISTGQKSHKQIYPQPGWVEHNPREIWANVREVVGQALARADITRHELAAVGITNQRETTIVWNRHTGRPVYNAIVWQDIRTREAVEKIADGDPARLVDITGLPLSAYFSASKIAWILDNVDGAREAAEAGDLLFGTPDTWVLWNLTGGPAGGVHVTDVTNASRTLLFDLRTLAWRDDLLELFGIPRSMLPDVRSSSEVYGTAESSSLLRETPVAGILGDQQAAAFGQAAFAPGAAKNTYGTGNFVLVNTGTEPVFSQHGLITTVGYRLGEGPAHYALEGSIAVTGSLVEWLIDNLAIAKSPSDLQRLANTVDNNGGVYIVPAFSGLFAPYWRSDARGAIVGLTAFATRAHIARAALESTAFQSRDVIDAVIADTGVPLRELRVDGGATVNDQLMQFQADVLGVPVVRPAVIETTALGAAYAAGLAVGFWSDLGELASNWREDARWEPQIDAATRDRRMRHWSKAIARTLGWVDDDVA